MIFRKTTEADIKAVCLIFEGARETMHARGIDQWTDGYPAEKDVCADIAAGYAHVLCEDDGTVVATCAVLLSGEPDYAVIRAGKWLTESRDDTEAVYCAMHRVATAKTERGRGLASRMVSEVGALARAAGKKSIRIDTHKDNLPMQGMLARNGFIRCGEVTVRGGGERIAFEKLL